jgi:hypothetical protein
MNFNIIAIIITKFEIICKFLSWKVSYFDKTDA